MGGNMITEKDREEAVAIVNLAVKVAQPFGAEPELESLCEELARIRAESAEQARKEAADRVRKEFGAQEGGSNTIDRVCVAILGDSVIKESLITDHIPDIGKKLAIAVKALEEILYRHGLEAGVAADCCHIANTALKEIQK
jgi:hypothetical protein